MATIKAPAGNINSTIAGVSFVDGVAETEDAWVIAYFTRAGYDVDDPALPAALTWAESKDPATMTVAELRDYATVEEIDLTGLTRKDDILAAILLPGAPTSVAATPGDAQVSVAWTAPTDTGPGTISGYQVGVLDLDDPEAVEELIADTASPLVVAELTNATEYRFRVRAINQHGTGPWSAADTATPTGA